MPTVVVVVVVVVADTVTVFFIILLLPIKSHQRIGEDIDDGGGGELNEPSFCRKLDFFFVYLYVSGSKRLRAILPFHVSICRLSRSTMSSTHSLQLFG